MSAKLTAEDLRREMSYDPETGEFTRLLTKGRNSRWKAGSVVGCKDKHSGYTLIRINDVLYRASRLAWLYMTGEWPKEFIDHVDLDRGNNKWGNLREATRSQNNSNRRKKPSCSNPLKGITFHANGWSAQISAQGKHYYLGRYKTPEQAHDAYAAEAVRLHGQYSRLD